MVLCYAMLSRFSRVRLFGTPWTAAHQAPLSLGLSRQEHWSGLPSPSPMHESEKWKWSRSVVSDSSGPRGPQPTRLLRPWDSPGRSPGVGAIAFSEICTIPPLSPNFFFLKFSSTFLSNTTFVYSDLKTCMSSVFCLWIISFFLFAFHLFFFL